MLEEKKQTPGGVVLTPLSSLTDAIHEVAKDKTGNHSLLMEGKPFLIIIQEAWNANSLFDTGSMSQESQNHEGHFLMEGLVI